MFRTFFLLTPLWLTGCFAAHNTAATSEYARQVSTAPLRVSQLEQQLVEAQERIVQLEEVIRLQGQSDAQALENVDQVNAELARLRGRMEVLEFNADEMGKSVTDQQLSQEQRQLHDEARLRQLEGFLGVQAPPLPSVSGGSDTEAVDGASDEDPDPYAVEPTESEGDGAADEPIPETASGKLELAAGHMEEGRQTVARAILEQAITQHTGDALTPELRYRLAETWFNEGDWRRAILGFQTVIDNHPDSEWACWGYFRQGESMEAFQGLQQAGPFYQGATQGACKTSEAAKAAKKKL